MSDPEGVGHTPTGWNQEEIGRLSANPLLPASSAGRYSKKVPLFPALLRGNRSSLGTRRDRRYQLLPAAAGPLAQTGSKPLSYHLMLAPAPGYPYGRRC